MSTQDYSRIKTTPLLEMPHLPAHLVAEWLSSQSDYIGEAVAKACYQQIAGSTC